MEIQVFRQVTVDRVLYSWETTQKGSLMAASPIRMQVCGSASKAADAPTELCYRRLSSRVVSLDLCTIRVSRHEDLGQDSLLILLGPSPESRQRLAAHPPLDALPRFHDALVGGDGHDLADLRHSLDLSRRGASDHLP